MIKIRPATREDIPAVLRLIQELANFEKMPDGPELSVERMTSDGFPVLKEKFSLFNCFVAIDDYQQSKEGIVGFSLFYPTYRTSNGTGGRAVYMEDLYVSPERRGSGIGLKLWAAVADWTVKYCRNQSIAKMFYAVLGWNSKAIHFYLKHGAQDLTCSASGQVLCYRISNFETMNRFRTSGDVSLSIRPMVSQDCDQVAKLIKESNEDSALTADQLRADGFPDLSAPCFYGWVATDKHAAIVGYCLIHLTYSTWQGLAAGLSDIYVQSDHRRSSIGTALLAEAVSWARKTSYGPICRLDIVIDQANREAISFLESCGALNMTASEDWHSFMLDADPLHQLAAIASSSS